MSNPTRIGGSPYGQAFYTTANFRVGGTYRDTLSGWFKVVKIIGPCYAMMKDVKQ